LKVLVDTPIWSLALRRQAQNLNPHETRIKALFSELVADGRVMMVGPVRQEILSGLRDPAQFRRLRELLAAFPDFQLRTADFERAAEMSNTCASRGIAGTATDMLICSVAYAAGAAIMSSDRDFMGYSKSLPIRLFTAVV
jgi:hypothetical protein